MQSSVHNNETILALNTKSYIKEEINTSISSVNYFSKGMKRTSPFLISAQGLGTHICWGNFLHLLFRSSAKWLSSPTPDSELPLTCFSKTDEVTPLSSNSWSPGNFSTTKLHILLQCSCFLCADLAENNWRLSTVSKAPKCLPDTCNVHVAKSLFLSSERWTRTKKVWVMFPAV